MLSIICKAQNTPSDPNASLYIKKAGIESSNEKNAINKFVRALKYYGVWDNIHALYIPTGGTELSHKLNLKDPRDANDAFRLLYPNGAEHSNYGTDWNGENQGAFTFYSPTSTRLHLMVYQDEETDRPYIFSGDKNGITDFYAYTWSALFSNGVIGFANQGYFDYRNETENKGFFFGQRVCNDSTEGYVNGILRNKWFERFSEYYNTDTSQKIWINKSDYDSSFLGTARYQVLSIGNAMDSSTIRKYYEIVQAFLTQLGIQYGEALDWPPVPDDYISDYTCNLRWIKATEQAIDTAIDGAHLFSINDSLYLWGGWNGNWYPFDFNSGFVSGDGGRNWNKIGQAPWNPRHTAAYGTDKNGIGYLIGSDMQPETTEEDRKEVWKTMDGRNWELQTNNAPWSGDLFLHGLAIKGDTLYVAGGQFGTTISSPLNDTIWQSIDGGVNWTATNTNANQLGGILYNNFKYFSARKKFIAFCGGVSDINPEARIFANQIWSSDDCVTWTRENDIPFAPRQYSDMVEWDDKLWVWGGDRSAQTGGQFLNLKDLWYMDKEGKWHEVGSIPVPPRHATALAVDKKSDHLVFACGNMHTDVWYLERSLIVNNQEAFLNQDCSFIIPNYVDSLKDVFGDQVNFIQTPVAGTIMNSSPGETYYSVRIVADFGNGNVQNFKYNLQLKDTTKPQFNIQPDRIVYLGNNCSLTIPDLVTGISINDCSKTSVIQTPLAGTIVNSLNEQTYPVSISVSDAEGNTSSAIVMLTAKDTTAPVITAVNSLLFCQAPDHNYSIPLPEATDNCGIDKITYSITGATTRIGNSRDASGFFNTGTNAIKWTVTDIHGNSNTFQTLVNIPEPLNATIPDVNILPQGVSPNTIYNGYGPTVLRITAQVNNGIPPYSYVWSDGSTTRSIEITKQTSVFNYHVTVTDSLGCIANAEKEIHIANIRCGIDQDKVSVCKFENGKLTTACIDSSAVAALLEKQSYLGICANNITNIISRIPENEISNKLQVVIMPNPASQFFTIKIQSLDNKQICMKVIDAVGTKLEEKNNLFPGALLQIGQQYLPGIYFLEIWQGKERAAFKLIKSGE